jgi:hypothetical protein
VIFSVKLKGDINVQINLGIESCKLSEAEENPVAFCTESEYEWTIITWILIDWMDTYPLQLFCGFWFLAGHKKLFSFGIFYARFHDSMPFKLFDELFQT